MVPCHHTRCDLALVERCAVNAQDLGGLLLLHSSTGNREGMLSLAEDAKKAGRTNVAFLSLFVCGKVRERDGGKRDAVAAVRFLFFHPWMDEPLYFVCGKVRGREERRENCCTEISHPSMCPAASRDLVF